MLEPNKALLEYTNQGNEVAVKELFLSFLSEIETSTKITALQLAASKGFASIVDLIIENRSKPISNNVFNTFDDRVIIEAFVSASANNMVDTVDLFAKKYYHHIELEPSFISIAFDDACKKGNIEILSILLNKFYQNSTNIKEQALVRVAEMGNDITVDFLLNTAITEISDQFREGAIKYSARNGHDKVFNLIINKLGAENYKHAIGRAFIAAISNEKYSTSDMIIATYPEYITSDNKGKAFMSGTYYAPSKALSIVQYVISNYGNDIPDQYKIEALTYVSLKHDAEPLVSLLINNFKQDFTLDNYQEPLDNAIISGQLLMSQAICSAMIAMVENSCNLSEGEWQIYCEELNKRDVYSSNFTLPLLGFNHYD